MKSVSEEIQQQSIASLESTCRKLANAYQTALDKGASTTLIAKRLDAMRIGLDSLRNVWKGEPFTADGEKVMLSMNVLRGILPSIEAQITRAKDGSPQRTLNQRRLVALQLAIASLEQRMI